MQQYLINATAIWLISLLMFDLFLRRESYHGFNRFYLLFTFLLGAVLPVIQWQNATLSKTAGFLQPFDKVVTLKQTAVTAATPVEHHTNWTQWIIVAYMAGALIMFSLLILDIIKTITLYTRGRRSQQNGWRIVETGKEHTPFSFWRTLFVCSMKQYDGQQWQMILDHEDRHTSLFHLADLVLMQVARVLFWFHPIVYIYNKRLLLVHEYQADNVTTVAPKDYGMFLIEQALLRSAPSISHSFNRSPIKKRIVMLTRTSTAFARIKMLVFIPLIVVCALCFSRNSLSQNASQKSKIVEIMPFGVRVMGLKANITVDQMLANPVMLCREPNCEIEEFTISFLPEGKDFIGPYTIKGSPRVQEAPLKVLRRIKEDGDKKVRVFIENIKVKHDGVEENLSPIVFVSNN